MNRYCYHCGISHTEEEMRLMTTKAGKRWRCIKTIDGVKKSKAERDAFGRQVSLNHKKPKTKTASPSFTAPEI